MSKKLFHLFLLFVLTTFVAIGCNSGGGGGDGDSCDGLVPCITTDFGDTFYEFVEADGESVVISSDGVAFGGAGTTDDGFLIGLGGEVVDCNNGKIMVGGLDYNLDGVVDFWFDTASGNVNICDKKLKVTNLILDGDRYDDIVATYVGIAASVAQESQHDSEHAIISETLDRLREE
jgi:hypothetical protein